MFVNPRMPPCYSYAIMHHINITFSAKMQFAKVGGKGLWEPTITLHLWIMDLGS